MSDGKRSIAQLATEAGLRRVHVITWRDLDHPEAGGSEVHIAALCRRWAAAGVEITLRTGAVPGGSRSLERDGYTVRRAGGRISVLARNALTEALHAGGRHGLVEVWHGINFLAPLWARGPRIAFAHHVHAGQFGAVLPAPAARVAEGLERHAYPRLYRTTPLVTLSPSSRDALIELGYRPDRVTAVPPGVDERFTPGGQRAAHPLVVTVGRLVPQKATTALIEIAARVREHHPALTLAVVGDGPCADDVRAAARRHGSWVEVWGRVDDETLLDLYRRAWVVASASTSEGWNMTLTEAGACGTPAVATRIEGHRDAVVDGTTGILADDEAGLATGLITLLDDADLRNRMGAAAASYAREHTWDEAARAVFEVLAHDALRRSRAT